MKPISEKRIDKLQFFLIAVIGWFASGSLPFIALPYPYFEDGTPAIVEFPRV
jgi:hypothetical protein